MKLTEWTTLFLKHQDVLKKSIQSINTQEQNVVVQKKTGEELWVVNDELILSNNKATGVVCLNTKKNFDTLIKEWPSIKESMVKIIFANPKKNERWMVVPGHHSRVSDEKALKAGLKAIYSGVSRV